MYKAVIFDLDGTLLDTLQDLWSSVNHALRQHDMAERTIDEIRSFVGDGVKKLVERAVPTGTCEETAEGVLKAFKAHYAIHNKDNTVPYEGVVELLDDLKTAGVKVAVVSNKIDSATKVLCKEYFGDRISSAIGDREDRAKKPAPDSVFAALEEIGAEVCDAVYVGDSEVDIMTARNSGVDCISVTWGFRSKDFLEESGARVFAEDVKELGELIFAN